MKCWERGVAMSKLDRLIQNFTTALLTEGYHNGSTLQDDYVKRLVNDFKINLKNDFKINLKIEYYVIYNKANDTTYFKCFECNLDARGGVTGHLDLSMNWYYDTLDYLKTERGTLICYQIL